MVDFTRAIKRPFADLTKFIIGAVLSIIPIVNILAMGYELKCAKSAMKGDYKLPEWTEWGDLFMKGLTLVVILVIYSVTVLIIPILLVVMWQMGVLGSSALEGVVMVILGSFAVLGIYVLPSVIMSFVANDFKFGAAFKVGEIVKKTLNKDYFVTWLVVGVYSITLTIVLSFIPLLGTAIASFATGVTSMTAFGELYPKLKA
ncbi:MAG: DUF4013 domain-containing protein [Candidatus Altiarchaeales archaeon]|nr:DUF4013 domain-containing protein [Candidatus Altiarchaeota archaeon]MBU4266325.1 DUF4013 domain-containing protein [Candidatus Altiarchaeota archaeon]MBU4341440.1 DUF4013 domain-containing protein [Candidatus Altiarchaeota archaeon]MBU4406598.1 DUF4013 domain-containing protein [Candidatus Altiarchaeota archaeon]MCG2782556.1 DUF4013 domain-containing protein [Candidatus Altiarchaeales archaeon]